MQLDEFRAGLDSWLDENEKDLTPDEGGPLEAQLAHLAKVKRRTYDAGWMRWGWPERVSGLGGSNLLRAYLGEALTLRGLVDPFSYSMAEVLAPTMIDYAPPGLAADMVPLLLRGDETWCQGFSEPGTGSNLGALACRATRGDDGWRVTGQKVWTSYAQYAQRCVLLTRTGTPESAHRGITALFVDMDTPGITVRPIQGMHGADEFCEVFFDDVAVPFDRTLGDESQGWAVAMDLLPYERSTALWHRAAFLCRRFQQLLETAPEGALDPIATGETAQLLFAFRARSRAPPSTDWPTVSVSVRKRRSTRCWSPRPSRRCSILWPTLSARPSPSAATRSASSGGPSISTPAPRLSTAAPPKSSATSSPSACWDSVMDSAERELFARSVEAAMQSEDIDAALEDLGWRDALADDARAAVWIVFEAQGRACATSSALDHVDTDVRLLAVAHELIGTARTMLDLAREHALEREQFGQPIAMFQAVRHRLAEALIAVETAAAMVDAAWEDGKPETAAMAKALAGRGAKTAARQCQQVLAGTGFTTEHPFHTYFKRVLVLDQLHGNSKALTREFGERLISTRRLPAPLPL